MFKASKIVSNTSRFGGLEPPKEHPKVVLNNQLLFREAVEQQEQTKQQLERRAARDMNW